MIVRLLLLLIVVFALALIASGRFREWLMEEIKAFSDYLLLLFLRRTSQFGSELTRDGAAEQQLWRERRLRDLRGLALRARQRQTRDKEQGE